MKAIWNRTGDIVEIIRELNSERCIIECKNSYELTVGVEAKSIRTTARKVDLEIVEGDNNESNRKAIKNNKIYRRYIRC